VTTALSDSVVDVVSQPWDAETQTIAGMGLEQFAEYSACMEGLEGFKHFCRNYWYVEHPQTGEPVLLKPWPGQIGLAKLIFEGHWPVQIKARRTGSTTILVALDAWELLFCDGIRIEAYKQTRDYAENWIHRFNFGWRRLPGWMPKPTCTKNTTQEIQWERNGIASYLRAWASTANSSRGEDTNRLHYDEAGYQRYLKKAMSGAEPAIEMADGRITVTGTVEAPGDEFGRIWDDAVQNPDSKFTQFFTPCWDAPGRDQAWYDAEAKAHKDDPLYMKREYPRTAEEALEAAVGRVYPRFGKDTHQRHIDVLGAEGWQYYRAVDWGSSANHALVCLWVAWKQGNPALTFEPECINFLREHRAYHYADRTALRVPAEAPVKMDDHTCDAFRDLVASIPPLRHGWCHVYREIYVVKAAELGIDPVRFAEMIREQTTDREHVIITVADRTNVEAILTLCREKVPTMAHRPPELAQGRRTGSEKTDGIVLVNGLICGTPTMDHTPDIVEQVRRRIARGQPLRLDPTAPVEVQRQVMEAALAADEKRRARRARRARSAVRAGP